MWSISIFFIIVLIQYEYFKKVFFFPQEVLLPTTANMHIFCLFAEFFCDCPLSKDMLIRNKMKKMVDSWKIPPFV